MNITHTLLVSLLDYDPITGIFVRKDSGKVTGCPDKNGYLTIRVKNKLYYSHRLAWFYVHKVWVDFVDHHNNNRADNAITNLRESTRTQNNRNGPKRCTNKSGYKGVFFHKQIGKWGATITCNKKQLNLGWFTNPVDAAITYDLAAIKLHGQFAKTNKELGLIV